MPSIAWSNRIIGRTKGGLNFKYFCVRFNIINAFRIYSEAESEGRRTVIPAFLSFYDPESVHLYTIYLNPMASTAAIIGKEV